MKSKLNKVLKPLITIGALTLSHLSQATIVEFQTTHGNFKVNLFD